MTVGGETGDREDKETLKEDEDRGHWRNPLEFLLSTLGYAIGMGSLWRFPYLVMRNGGGAFLIPYIIFAAIFGFPLFFMESALGQYFQQSPIRVFDICPLFKGIGVVMCMVSVLVPVYYMTVIAWALYFLYNAFSSTLPWTTCGNIWNTNSCMPLTSLGNDSFNASGLVFTKPVLSTEEFWENKVLGITEGVEDVGSVQGHLALALLVGWCCIFICIFKGIESSRIAVYITATIPFILLIILCAWSSSFPGATDGMLIYITPRWDKMKNYQVWVEAFIQVFNSLGPAWGGLITLSSFNPFRHNCVSLTLDTM
ncbi:sodium- and chloride-dependent betaine transporter-like [Liolophura sinensis]|uniref:sodium- and chloride-dependent betaine transporter-like n=1 Tax=Liolophura sinensis TaxID=3198878 RepID=UPI003158A56D